MDLCLVLLLGALLCLYSITRHCLLASAAVLGTCHKRLCLSIGFPTTRMSVLRDDVRLVKYSSLRYIRLVLSHLVVSVEYIVVVVVFLHCEYPLGFHLN